MVSELRSQLDFDGPLAARCAPHLGTNPKKAMSVAAISAVDENDVAAAAIAVSAAELDAPAFELPNQMKLDSRPGPRC